ncbi:5'-nucleotidase [compost metagenome]
MDKSSVVMIGDRKFDIIGAHANGIDSIAVGYGYGSGEELTASEPTHYVKTVGELRDFFA